MTYRVVSLFPAATETLQQIVEESHQEGRPVDVIAVDNDSIEYFHRASSSSSLPRVVTQPKGSWEEFEAITAAYKEVAFLSGATDGAALVPLLEFHLSVYQADLEALRSLPRPDVVVTQVQQQGDWFTVAEAERALGALWPGDGPVRIVQIDSKDLRKSMLEVLSLARALGREEAGERVVRSLSNKLATASQMAQGRPRPRVAVLQWLDPLYTACSWVPELITLANAEDVFAPIGFHPSLRPPFDPAHFDQPSTAAPLAPALEVTPALIASKRPQFVLFAICGVSMLEAASTVRRLLTTDDRWRALRDSRATMVVFEANRMFSRQGLPFVDTLEALVEALHPEVQPFGRSASFHVIDLHDLTAPGPAEQLRRTRHPQLQHQESQELASSLMYT